MQVERPQPVNEQIEKLLTSGTVEELRSEKGQFLRMFFTADEVSRAISLPMGEVVDFDGTTCKWCRGDMRYQQCGKCHGSFDLLPQGQELVSQRDEVQHEAKKKDTGNVKAFFDRVLGRDASY